MKKEEIVSLKQEMEINELTLYNEVLKQPSLFLKWAIRLARSARRVEENKLHVKVVAAEEMKKIREEYLAKTGKELAATAPTEKTDLPLREVYKTAIQEQIELEEDYDILNAAKEAARQRKDVLQMFCMMKRDEERSDIIIRNKSSED